MVFNSQASGRALAALRRSRYNDVLMVEILRNKNLSTRFQVLVEIAGKGPNVPQADIARRLNVTPQAVSEYVKQLSAEGLLAIEGRAKYKVTGQGVNWMLKTLRELQDYVRLVRHAVNSISVSAAVADSDLVKGQVVGLAMQGGVLVATAQVGDSARGIAVADARRGGDVGVTGIEGIVKLEIGKVTILKVPGIGKGGSAEVDSERLGREVRGRPFVGAIGLEALTALKRIGVKAPYFYGVTGAAGEAARSGLNPAVVCVEEEIPRLTATLEEEGVDYGLVDLSKG